jgi:FtsP/CotA-like multicopper oxidase with cupredoxin domain
MRPLGSFVDTTDTVPRVAAFCSRCMQWKAIIFRIDVRAWLAARLAIGIVLDDVLPLQYVPADGHRRALLYNRGYGSVEYRNDEDLLTIALSDAAPVKTTSTPSVKRSIVPAAMSGATPVNMTFTLLPVDGNGHSEFRINDVPFWKARPFHARLGETQIWTVKNDTQWDHPFHLHGYFFLVLDADGAPVRPLAWKDTVNIPMKTTARLLVTFDDRPGEWMIHCHILDHAEGGLMGTVRVGDPATTTSHTHRLP